MATPTEPIEEQMAAYVVGTLLPKITTKGGSTYWFDIGSIGRIPRVEYAPSEMPALVVSTGNQNKETRTSSDIYSELDIEVAGVAVFDENELDLDTYANRLVHDIETAVFTDQAMNGVARGTWIRSVRIERALNWGSREVQVRCTFTLEFRHTQGSP